LLYTAAIDVNFAAVLSSNAFNPKSIAMAKTKSFLGNLWSFARQPTNRAVLSWIGGGIVTVAVALWTVFIYLAPPNKSEPSVQANCGGVVVGRDISGSNVQAGDCVQAPKAK
jgi:hypothetical protein